MEAESGGEGEEERVEQKTEQESGDEAEQVQEEDEVSHSVVSFGSFVSWYYFSVSRKMTTFLKGSPICQTEYIVVNW